MKEWFYLLPLAILLILPACSDGTYSDLDQFIKGSGKDLHGRVIPPLVTKSYKRYSYDAFDIPDPFKPRKGDSIKGEGGGLQPDLKRRKELLESFSLEDLKMVGSLQQNKVTYALIKTPDGTLHRVTVGDYLGQDFGLIIAITEFEIQFKEIVQDNIGDWVGRVSTLMLGDQEQGQ